MAPRSLNPLFYVSRAVLEPDAVELAACQKRYRISIDELHVLHVQDYRKVLGFQVEQSSQLRQKLHPNSTAQAKNDDSIIHRPVNLQCHSFSHRGVLFADRTAEDRYRLSPRSIPHYFPCSQALDGAVQIVVALPVDQKRIGAGLGKL